MARTRLAGCAVVAAAALFSTPALAGPTEVCTLTSTETRTAPRKPNIFEMKLDCGAEPSEAQARAIVLANNAMNTVDALEVVSNMGYEIEVASWRDSYTGRQIIGVYTLVSGEGAMMSMDDDDTMGMPDDGMAPLPEFEEEPSVDLPPADEEAAESFEETESDDDIDFED